MSVLKCFALFLLFTLSSCNNNPYKMRYNIFPNGLAEDTSSALMDSITKHSVQQATDSVDDLEEIMKAIEFTNKYYCDSLPKWF